MLQNQNNANCHCIYPKNTLEGRNYKEVEIAQVVILASNFLFFHTVGLGGSQRTQMGSLMQLNQNWKN